ncbi:MAG: dynamin family protein [Helicobacteraceae bacterium]
MQAQINKQNQECEEKKKKQEEQKQEDPIPPRIKDLRDHVGDLNGLFHFLRNKEHIRAHVHNNLDELERFVEEMKAIIKEKKAHDKLLADVSLRHELISAIFAAKNEHEGLKMFHNTLEGKYMEFTKQDDSLSNEAEVFWQLQAIEKELSVIAALHQKRIVAVGGGFSAGKSKFISSFIRSGVKLPTSIEPTTAIPAYVMKAPQEGFVGFSKTGGSVDLCSVNPKIHCKLNHQFMQGFKFNIKDILPFVVLATDLQFENICFVDTPRYNSPSGMGNYDADLSTAKEFLEKAQAFLWLVGLGTNGTISNDDLDFLSELDLEGKELYVVLNKADLKSSSDLKKIIESVQENLDTYGIEYAGIQTFSAKKSLENPYVVGKSLNEFLEGLDRPKEKHKEIFAKLNAIYQMHKRAIKESAGEKRSMQSELHSIGLDLVEEGFDDMDSNAHIKLSHLKKAFSTGKEEKNLKLLDTVMDDFKEAVNVVFGITQDGLGAVAADARKANAPTHKQDGKNTKNKKNKK